MAVRPRCSVVIPAYNSEAGVGRAIASVLGQTMEDLELWVVDDGSEDRTRDVVAGIGDPRLHYRRQEHAGRSRARNHGAELARGRFLTFLDSDDEVVSSWLAKLCARFDDPAVAVVCCGARLLINRPELERTGEEVRLPSDLGPVYGHEKGLFLAGTFALPRTLFLELGGYEPQLEFSENTDLALRLVSYCRDQDRRIASVDEPLLVFHNQRPVATDRRAAERLQAAKLIIARHGTRYRRASRRSFTNYHAIAGVNAARLGAMGEARFHFLRAALWAPWIWRHWLRLTVALVPLAGSQFWNRYLTTGSRDG